MADSDLPKRVSQLAAVGFVWDVLISIALPTVLFALAGRWLDRRWHSSPWMTLVGLVLALSLAGFLVYRKARQYAEDMKQEKRADETR